MTSQTLANIIPFSYIGLLMIAFAVAWRGLRASYSRPVSKGLVFRRPWEQCACLGLLGIVCLLLPFMEASNDLSLYGAVLPRDWPPLLALAGIGLAGAALFWWMGCPVELTLDEEGRTYRRTAGWPPFSRTQTGSYLDLPGVGAMIGGGHRTYFVYIGWRKDKIMAARFLSAEAAEYYADELAAVLDVPRLAPGSCRWPQLSRQKQRAYAEAANARPTYRRCRCYLSSHFELCLRPNESTASAVALGANEDSVD